jgi:outer membrane protein W
VVFQAGVSKNILPFVGIGLHGEYFMDNHSGNNYGGYGLGLGLSIGF